MYKKNKIKGHIINYFRSSETSDLKPKVLCCVSKAFLPIKKKGINFPLIKQKESCVLTSFNSICLISSRFFVIY